MAQPQNIGSKVIELLNLYQVEGRKLTELDKARFVRDIESLKRVNLPSGLMAYGIYYACLDQEALSIENHEKSVAASGRETSYLVNYAISLTHFLRFSKAFDVFLEALKKDPANLTILRYLSQIAFFTGNASRFSEALRLHLRAAQEEKAMELPTVHAAVDFFDDIDSLGISERDLLATFSHLEKVYSEHGLMPAGAMSSINDADGHKYLSVEIKVDCSGAQLALINDRFVGLVSEDLNISSWNKLICSFVYGRGAGNIFQDS